MKPRRWRHHPRWVLLGAVLALGLDCDRLLAAPPVPGKNTVPLRSVDQDVIYLPPQPSSQTQPVVLFLPGDAGWRGFAVDLAQAMAALGHPVFVLDTKTYLTGFTNGQNALTTRQIGQDLRRLIRWIAPPQGKVIVVGWSQGAAMAVLAAQGRGGHHLVSGVVTISLPEEAALGWSWKDTLFSLFRKKPHQPHFLVREHLSAIAPVPLCMIHPGDDAFTSAGSERALYNAAEHPKRLVEIPGANHSFDLVRDSFWAALRRGLEWLAEPASSDDGEALGQAK